MVVRFFFVAGNTMWKEVERCEIRRNGGWEDKITTVRYTYSLSAMLSLLFSCYRIIRMMLLNTDSLIPSHAPTLPFFYL